MQPTSESEDRPQIPVGGLPGQVPTGGFLPASGHQTPEGRNLAGSVGKGEERVPVTPPFQIVWVRGDDRRLLPLGEALRQAGYSVNEVSNLANLQAQAASAELVILEDSLGPGMALQALRQLRKNLVTESVPVLLLGGELQSATLADGYLAADPEPAEVLAWTRALLRNREALRLETLGRLTSCVAHDFNNLLMIVAGHVALLSEQLPANESTEELIQGVKTATEAATQLAGQLLELVRKKPETPRPVDVGAVVVQLANLLRRTFSPRIQIQVDVASALPAVRAVPCQLTQVLLNLCLNARDAMLQGGRLLLTAALEKRPEGEFVRLRVTDTGEGIPPEVLPHLFTSFFTTRNGKGTGLGLATVQRIVQQHGGWITCTSQVGEGTRFDVYLPALRDSGGALALGAGVFFRAKKEP